MTQKKTTGYGLLDMTQKKTAGIWPWEQHDDDKKHIQKQIGNMKCNNENDEMT